MNITKGKVAGAIRAIIYGTEGIGKSTLAAQIPGVLFVDIEDSTKEINCDRTQAFDWRAIEAAVAELVKDSHGYKAVAFDTADWLEKALVKHMTSRAGKASIEDFGYGKGYTILAEHMSRFLDEVDKLIAKGVHVVFVAHSITKRISPPDQTDGYDRWELKLSKQVGPLLKEWSDLTLFCNYKINIVEGTDGKLKAQGGKERVMHAEHSAAWDAKNRFGLPAEMPMQFSYIAHLFGAATPKAATAQGKALQSAEAAPAPSKPADAPLNLATVTQQAEIAKLAPQTNAAALQIVEAALNTAGAMDASELKVAEANALIAQLKAMTAQPTPAVPPNVAAWLDANAADVNAYLARVGWVAAGKTWRDMAEDKLTLVGTKPDKFARAAGLKTLP